MGSHRSHTVRAHRTPDSGDVVNEVGRSLIGPPFFEAYGPDNKLDWPYPEGATHAEVSVAEWWEAGDCRHKRLIVGEDNQYLNAAVEEDLTADPQIMAIDEEESDFCKHFPAAEYEHYDPFTPNDVTTVTWPLEGNDILSLEDQERVE